MRRVLFVLSIVLVVVWMPLPAAAQTCGWSALGSGIGHYPGWLAQLFALAAYDDAVFPAPPAPALYAAGEFSTAGSLTEVHRIAKWDGTTWSAVGSGVTNVVWAVTVFDDGTGPALYAGGAAGIDKWNGTEWSAIPLGGVTFSSPVRALKAFDDGTGPALYAGSSGIGKWNGTQWSAVGAINVGALALTVFDDGMGLGPALYSGGAFSSAGGVPFNNLAKWNGTQWSVLGSGVGSASAFSLVNAVTDFDDGTGPALYAGGIFNTAGGAPANNIAWWRCKMP
jgi:hypothetical protein